MISDVAMLLILVLALVVAGLCAAVMVLWRRNVDLRGDVEATRTDVAEIATWLRDPAVGRPAAVLFAPLTDRDDDRGGS